MELKIKLHPLFIIFGFFLISFGLINLFFTYFLVLILHELGHYLTAKFLGYKLNKIVFMPYGVSLNGRGNIFKKRDEILICLAGPAVNFLLCVICVSLWWSFPTLYFYTEEFVYSNLCLGLFNLLPVFPLDGGRLFVAIGSFKFNKYKVIKAMKILSIVGSFIFMVLFLISVFYNINITMFFIATFLLVSALDGKNSYVYERAFKFLKNSSTKPLEVKTFVVNKSMPLNNIAKLISGNYYVQIKVVDEHFNEIKTLNENEVLELVAKQSITEEK